MGLVRGVVCWGCGIIFISILEQRTDLPLVVHGERADGERGALAAVAARDGAPDPTGGRALPLQRLLGGHLARKALGVVA